jgi:preprotein translocase subunit SecF
VAERSDVIAREDEEEEEAREAEERPAEPEAATPERRVRRLNIIGYRNWYFAFSLLIILPGLWSMVIAPRFATPNTPQAQAFLYGIDFAGGTELVLHFDQNPGLPAVESYVSSQSPGSTVQQTAQGTYLIRTSFLDPAGQQRFEDGLKQKFGSLRVDQAQAIGGVIAQETVIRALGAVVLAAVLILALLTWRFRKVGGFAAGFQFGGSALLALLHDLALLTGVFSIIGARFGLRIGEIDGPFLAAVLTVVGFSVHDTIVVFDRIRENMIVSQRLSFDQVVNLSIMQTAARSIITSFTVVMVLLALLVIGGESLRGFVLALLIGIVSGTYSSIFNAAPLLVVWRRWQPIGVYRRYSQVAR